MKRLLTFAVLAGSIATATAAEQNPAEAKLRETLRNTMLQLRTEQSEKVALQATQAESEAKIKELTSKLEALTKQSVAEQTASRKQIDELKAQGEQNKQQILKLDETLGKWKAGYNEAASVAKAKEAERAKLADEAVLLKRRISDQQSRNLALFKLGNEILVRYEKFSLGEAIKAREPFTGITRARLETLIQADRDKLVDERIKPEPVKASVANKKS